MKNILVILSFISICFGCKAQQQILPLETKGWHIEGAYYKDINNELDPYTGTWQGVFEGKTFVITFSKIKVQDSFIVNYSKDRIMGRYKMLEANGNQLYSTYNLPVEQAKVTSLGFVNRVTRDKLRLMFIDNCIEGEIHLNFENPQKTQMHWQYYTNQTITTDNSNCAPFNEMPRGAMTLIKQ